MILLVTGGAGFIGSHFVRYTINNHPEDRVIVLDSLTYAGNFENLKDIESDKNFEFVRGDICDPDIVFDLVKKSDAVVHFAAETHVDRSIIDSSPFARTNVLGTQVLLDAAVSAGNKRFHHISTDEVFGALGPGDAPFNENTPYDPRNPYSASKAASDHLVRAYFYTHGLPITISNCSNNYGPNQFPEKIIPLLISNLQEGKKIPIYGDGGQIRDWIYVTDHCRGVDEALRRGRIGETYLFGGGGKEITNLELAKKLISILGASDDSIEFVKDRPGHDRRYAIDYSKSERELGWKPSVTLDDGLSETVKWYLANPDWTAHCKSGEYAQYYEKNYGGKISK
ncbi:MAG: hypothetical protein ACD_76C00015G0002 [uncultured bacterium]|nr:MAG: hypothetical protein ACD_76C00015G0002 [uncultured bacterium]HBD05057.1 dTDP-glucose 4,6-dehydratase [Candidatus Uhrbacteria bacterium]